MEVTGAADTRGSGVRSSGRVIAGRGDEGGRGKGHVLVVDLVLDRSDSRAGEAPDGLGSSYEWLPGRPEDRGSPCEKPAHAIMSQNHGQEVVKWEVSIRLLGLYQAIIFQGPEILAQEPESYHVAR